MSTKFIAISVHEGLLKNFQTLREHAEGLERENNALHIKHEDLKKKYAKCKERFEEVELENKSPMGALVEADSKRLKQEPITNELRPYRSKRK